MTANDTPGSLGAFLQASRARITPEEAGLTLYGDRRRVPGLRREELAMLAGVSVSYLTRLEQGQSRGASLPVLDALASALHLNESERQHVRRLAEHLVRRPAPRRPTPEVADPALAELLGSVGDVPTLVLGRRSDVLAWNPLGHALLCGHLNADAPATAATRPNMAAQVFLDANTRELYTDWRAKCRAVVGNLRLVVGQHPDDPVLASLIGSLSIASAEFASLWADHRVQACATAVYTLHHPLVGDVAVTQQTLRSIDRPDQTLVTHTAPAASPSAEALTLLAQIVGDRPAHRLAAPSGRTLRGAGGDV
ncbi:helix-turn-helix transcriptional regulator [soil metagenome]